MTRSRSKYWSVNVTTTPATENMQREVIQLVREQLAAYSGITVHHDPDAEAGNPGRFCPFETLNLHTSVLNLLERRYARGLFSHQREAVKRVLSGQNTVVATRTSSGKSLIYALPVFDALCRDPNATSLFLYPQKALANDQLIKLREMAADIEPVHQLLKAKRRLISRYDGSTPEDNRPEIRREVQVLLTNPDMLHLGILQHHEACGDDSSRTCGTWPSTSATSIGGFSAPTWRTSCTGYGKSVLDMAKSRGSWRPRPRFKSRKHTWSG